MQALEKADAVTNIEGSQADVAAEVEGKVIAVDLSVWLVQATTQTALYEAYGSPHAACLKIVFDRVSHSMTLCGPQRLHPRFRRPSAAPVSDGVPVMSVVVMPLINHAVDLRAKPLRQHALLIHYCRRSIGCAMAAFQST